MFFVLESVARASALGGGGSGGRWDTAASWFYSIPINDLSEAPPLPPFTKQPSSASPAVLGAGCWVVGEASRRKLHEPLLPQRPPSAPRVEWCSPPLPFPSSSLAGVVTTPDSEWCLCPPVPRFSFHFRRVIICLLWFLSVILTTTDLTVYSRLFTRLFNLAVTLSHIPSEKSVFYQTLTWLLLIAFAYVNHSPCSFYCAVRSFLSFLNIITAQLEHTGCQGPLLPLAPPRAGCVKWTQSTWCDSPCWWKILHSVCCYQARLP